MLQADCLPDFLAELRATGFAVGPGEHEKVVALLMHLENSNTMPQSSKRLSNMLGSILCTNVEQQCEFELRFASYFGVWGSHRTEPLSDPDAATARDAEKIPREPSLWNSLTSSERRMLRRVMWTFLAMFALIDIVPSIVMGYMGGQIQLRHFYTAPQVALLASSDSLGPWSLFIVFPLFALLAYWIASPARPFSAFLLRRQVKHAPEMVRLLLRGSGPTPFKTAKVQRAIQLLRRPRWIDSEDLAVDATLNATIRNGGLFTPVHAPRRMAPEYLVLIDRRSIDDHVAAHADSLVAEFRQAMLYVDCYYFNADPRRAARSPDAPSVSLDELVSRHPDHRLIMVTTGEGLFDPVTGARHDWTDVFTSFLTRVLLTPLPNSLWGYREAILRSELNLPAFNLAPDSIPAMTTVLIDEVQARRPKVSLSPCAEQPALRELVDILDDRPIRWINDIGPGSDAQDELLSQLKTGLGPELVRSLQAAAAYPALNYRLTQHLRQVVATGACRPSDSALLFSLPWFRKGHMPLWLRRRLIVEATAIDIVQIKTALNKLLLSFLGRSTKTISLDAGTNRPMLPKEKAILEHLNRRLHDPVLIEFLARRQRDPTTVRLPRIVARMLAHGGWMHNIFSKSELDEIESSAHVLNENVRQLQITQVNVEAESADGMAVDGRRVNKILDSKGVEQTLGHGCYIFLFGHDPTGRLIDDFTASIFLRRRTLARRLAFANLALVVGLGMTFYNGEEQLAAFGYVGVAVFAAIAWIVAPFWLMHMISVKSVVSRILQFPACYPASKGFGGESLTYEVIARFDDE